MRSSSVLRGIFTSAIAAAAGFCTVAGARADAIADFYKGKQMSMVIGIPAGGGYDLYARLVARHLSRHIPGQPSFVPQNMPGGGELTAANYVVNTAPQNGTVIGAVVRTVPFQPLYGNAAAKFDPLTVNWLGSSNQDVGLFVAWHTSKVRTIRDIFANEIIVGANPAGSDTVTYANVLKYLFEAKLKIVSGYPGSEDIALAMQRGEVEATPNYSWASLQRHADWIADKKVRILLQNGLKKLADFPDVPLILDLARNDEDRAILELILGQTTFGRPYFMGPKVPADRVAALRAAFMATMEDKELLADAKKQKLQIDPISGAEMQQIIARVYKTPRAVVERTNEIRSR